MEPCMTEMHRLHRQIMSMDDHKRYVLQPKLDVLINRMRQSGIRVPCDIARLNSALIDEAIEAQFDNLPV